MQRSELFRRGVVIPLTDDTHEALIINDVSETDNLNYIKISEEAFNNLYNGGFFDMINQRLGTLLDDYEDETVDYSKALSMIKLIKEYSKRKKLTDEENKVLNLLNDFCLQADKLNRPLFFVL